MRIGVSIPTYNRTFHLNNLLCSLDKEFQVYVSDNGAKTDGKLFDKFPWVSISATKHVLPMYENWNRSVEINDCDYVSITSDDDLYLKGAYEVIKEYLQMYQPDVAIFGHACIDEHDQVFSEYLPEETRLYSAPEGFEKFVFDVEARTPSVFFKRSFLNQIGLLDTSFKVTAADSEFIQRAMFLGNTLFVRKIVSKYRVWSNNATSNSISTASWLQEIDCWTKKIICLASGAGLFTPSFCRKYKDEVYARNFYAGLINLFNRKEYNYMLGFKSEARWPKNALLKTKLRIIRLLLKAKILSYVS